MRALKPFFLAVDVTFIAYWLITALHLIPPLLAFKDYANPILSAWKLFFIPKFVAADA